MPRKPNPPPDDTEQAARFIEIARKLQKKESPQEFLKAVKVILPRQPNEKTRRKASGG